MSASSRATWSAPTDPAPVTAVTLEPYRPEDIDELIPMWRESFEHGVGIVDRHPIEEQRAYFVGEVLPKHELRVARRDGRMVGFIAASRESIGQLYVRKGFHRQGVGSQMLRWAMDQSSGSLWLHTFARNAAACAFYERHGFLVTARGHEPHWKLDDVRYEWRRVLAMPSAEILERFIARVESNHHAEAIEEFYTPGASMQENEAPPRVGRDNLAANERKVLARMKSVRSTCVRPVFVNGDRVVVRWIFEFETLEGARIRMEELACQRWEGDRIAEEKFFYDPKQLVPTPAPAET